ILSNALKNTEATEQTKFYKLSETDFKTKFESHLKTTGCDADAGDTNFTPNVCLADGSQFAYGTFDESCTDNICDTLTIDTNGKKGPNTAGKDRFTMNLTPNGLKALGESDTCSTGYDCGAYILAHHKLWTGEVEITQEPVFPEGCADAQCNSCTDSTFKPSGGACVAKTNTELLTECSGASSCAIKTNNGEIKNMTNISINVSGVNKNVYVSEQITTGKDTTWEEALSKCPEGTYLPNFDELKEIYKHRGEGNIPSGGAFWSSSENPSSPTERAMHVDFNSGYSGDGDKMGKLGVLCIGN
ncbi:hypothetical protein IJ732_03850, partial [bacterium]|nr:hypothetical protein [bacterium]